jgi:hypothetical protein
VIQVVPLDTPGLFRLWVSIDGNIQQLKVGAFSLIIDNYVRGFVRAFSFNV